MPQVDLATGARLDYEDVGSGPPLIALHGRLGTPRIDLGEVIDWLKAEYHVIAPTLRGYGASGPKPRDFPFDFYHRDARDVLALMDTLGLEQAHILGYSDGGETALVLAGLAPERCLSVIAWGAVGFYGPQMRPAAQRNYPGTWLTADDQATHGIENADAFALSWVQAVVRMIDSGGDVSLSLAPNVTCPALLMLGDQDHLNPEAYAQQWVDAAPNARLVMFPCGHAVHRQQSEAFRQTVGAFLAEVRDQKDRADRP